MRLIHTTASLVSAVAVMLCLAGGATNAALIGENDAGVTGTTSGDGFNITYDDVSGLRWLDLTITLGQSRNQVLASSLITSGAYRYATDAEVDNLFATNVGISFGPAFSGQTTPYFANAAIVSAGAALINFLGVTNGQVPIGSFGLVDSATTLPGGYNKYAIRQSSPSNPTIGLIRLTQFDTVGSTGGFAGAGSFLVQTSSNQVIPEAASLVGLGLGLAALGLTMGRRRKAD